MCACICMRTCAYVIVRVLLPVLYQNKAQGEYIASYIGMHVHVCICKICKPQILGVFNKYT